MILNYNCRELLVQCIQSALRQTFPIQAIIVIDNGSEDGSREAVSALWEQAIVLETNENIGFAGFNLGFKKALDLGCDYVFYADSDTWFEERMIENLVVFLDAHPRVGIAGPIQFEMESKDLFYVGSMLDLETFTAFPASYTGSPNRCDYVGNAMLRRGVIEKIEFDPTVFTYYNEVDICLRARALGFETYAVPRAKLFALESYTSRKIPGLIGFITTRNRLLVGRKHVSRRNYCRLCFATIVELVIKEVSWLKHLQREEQLMSCLGLISGLSILLAREEMRLSWKMALTLMGHKATIVRWSGSEAPKAPQGVQVLRHS